MVAAVKADVKQEWGPIVCSLDNSESIFFIRPPLAIRKVIVWAVLTNAVIEDAGRFMQEKKKELEQQSLQRQPIEKPPQENEQEQ